MNVENVNSNIFSNSQLRNITWLFYRPGYFFSKIDGFDKGSLVMPIFFSIMIALNLRNPVAIPLIFLLDIMSAFAFSMIYYVLFRLAKLSISILSLFSALLYIDLIGFLSHVLRFLFPFLSKKTPEGIEYSVFSVAYIAKDFFANSELFFKFLSFISIKTFCIFLLEVFAVSNIGRISTKRALLYCSVVTLSSTLLLTFF